MPIILPGDIGLTTSSGSRLSKLIRFFEAAPGKPKPAVSHAMMCTGPQQDLSDPMSAVITEAEWHTVEHTVHEGYDGTQERIAFFRVLGLTQSQRNTAVTVMRAYIGDRYGAVKLLACAADWCLGGKDALDGGQGEGAGRARLEVRTGFADKSALA